MSADKDTVQFIKGVGPKRKELFNKLDIYSIEDLLTYYPRTWQDRRLNAPVKLFEESSSNQVFFGIVKETSYITTRSAMGIFKAYIKTHDNKELEAVWYRRTSRFGFDPFASLKRHIKTNSKIWFVGKLEEKKGYSNQINADEFYMDSDETAKKIHINRIIPVYPLTEKLHPKFMRQTVNNALEKYGEQQPDCVPLFLREKRKLLSFSQSLEGIHFPNSLRELESARQRLAYEELLFLVSAWEIKKRQTKSFVKNYSYKIKKSILTPFKKNLGFEFTAAQIKSINEIFADMTGKRPMMRLLQGDVGSGKTVVALSSVLLAIENGYQAAFMAPTEILAEQHYLTFKKFLDKLPVKFELLTSKVKAADKKRILGNLKDGKIDILLGTHAVIEETVKFKNLRLAVIDEQHRFGVRQRATLRQKSSECDLLIMTATPIPRTLSLTLYGDLDVSVIDKLPPGRKPVKTISCDENHAFEIAKDEIKKGRQVYIVQPLIEESEKLNLKSVKKEFERLKNIFVGLKAEMLHGQMTAGQKAKVMEDFLNKKIDILVSTTVIEVGIDVKNASVMIIQNAERFGLASLHQLRGRVGRAEHNSTCVLIADTKTKQSKERIDILCRTNDGFKIGEKDIELRGPGEVIGVRQHGDMELKLADVVKDKEILKNALEDKAELFSADKNLVNSENRLFREKLVSLYSRKWHLIDLA